MVLRHREGDITVGELLLWLAVWLIVGIAVLLPQTTSFLANLVGVGRGVDLAVYLSIIFIFYILFRIFVRLERIEHDITKVIREMALKEQLSTKKSNENEN